MRQMEKRHQSTSPPSSSTSPSSTGRLHLPNIQGLNLNSNGSTSVPSTPRKDVKPPSTGTSPSVSHRASFIENMRGIPPSPRTQRTPSFSHQALQDLINNPPVARHDHDEDRFTGRDWRTIQVGEIIAPEEVRFVEVDTSVEDATKLLINSGAPNVVLIRKHKGTRTAVGAFDYDDLNAYLLLVTMLAFPTNAEESEIEDVLKRARSNQPNSLSDIKYLLGRKEPPAFLEHTDTLTKAVEIFGGGSHRIIVRKQGSTEVVGVLSQLRLVRFFWENVTSFRTVDELHSRPIYDLDVGSHGVVSINGDRPLKEALLLMHTEGVSSLPVLDNHKNVIGNISHVDVKLLTTTTALPLFQSSCTHFISVILSERGMNEGKDSYPVFHIAPFNTLAHTVAKLVATRSHRMWIVDIPSPSPASSVPPSPALKAASAPPPPAMQLPGAVPTPGPPYTPASPSVAINAAAIPSSGASSSGRLSGVVSLTDVLNLYARATGLSPNDPDETRRRRRSSSSSTRLSVDSASRPSDVGRASTDLSRSLENMRGGTELGRSGSQKRGGV